MIFTKDMTIKRKLTAIIMLTSAIILLLAVSIFIAWQQIDGRYRLVDSLQAQAGMIADNCKAALAFSDERDAEQTLFALNAQIHIVFACVYDKQGQIFAKYQRGDIAEEIQPPKHQGREHSFSNEYLTVFSPIKLDDEIVGTVCLLYDMKGVRAALRDDIVAAFIVLMLSILMGLILSSKFQKIVSGPILSLTKVAKDVSEKKDYSVRVPKQNDDEVGSLIEAFNGMLEQIQYRDSALLKSREQLETRVKDRTAELSSTNVKLGEEIVERLWIEKRLQHRIKQLNCFYGLSKLVEQPELSLEQIFRETAYLIRNAYQDPDNTSVRITFEGVRYKADRFEESESNQLASIKVGEKEMGAIEVCYIGEKTEDGKSPFLKEEHELLDAVTERLSRVIELKQAGESLQLFQDLIDHSNDCIFVINPENSCFLDVNIKACGSLGYTRKELLNMTFKDIEEPEAGEFLWWEHVEELRDRGDVIIQGWHKRKDKVRFFAETSLNLVSHGDDDYIIAISRDITERKQAEEHQARLLEKVENINEELQDFAHIISHDLKAPLRGVSTVANWLISDYSDKLDGNGKEQLHLLSSRVERMHDLIDGVLRYSKAGNEEEEKVQVNLNELVTEVIDMVAPPENIEITVENQLPEITCGKTRIIQVFQNLLSNAIKYMDKPQGQVKVTCIEEEGFWKFGVTDNGPGMEEKDFERIFKMFQTLTPKDEFESTGVGLTVVKKIVEMYDGRIWVESVLGKGSTFYFTLPKQESEVLGNA
ncbi:MAG: PAS domain S-box protein [Planctomycetes bacterium]|nr:PAS domain S-box protein [Planctomycetota bacterium]